MRRKNTYNDIPEQINRLLFLYCFTDIYIYIYIIM